MERMQIFRRCNGGSVPRGPRVTPGDAPRGREVHGVIGPNHGVIGQITA
jgi:hypothetical protein